ncbi:MAG: DUF115 domain-containing protein [Cellvibrionaceae bacterium]|nr:DUF115 domain-containing protein [Cellvibrionaceae bacterium]
MTHTQQQQQQAIEALVLKTQVVQAQLQLGIQFKKNMHFFKHSTPSIYDAYKNYVPKEQKLYFSEEGYVNLLNIASQTPSFRRDPKIFAHQQVDYFLKKPTIFKVEFKPTNIWNHKHIHVPLTNETIKRFDEEDLLSEPTTASPLGLVVMVGCGLGYQITELIERAYVQNLYIYDSNRDSFFASLHTVDWEYIVNTTKRKGGSVKLVLGKDDFNALTYMRLLTRQIGLHNTAHVFVFNHTSSEKNHLFLEKYRKDYHLNANFVGFFDDEQVGLAHTVHNLKRQLPLFNPVGKAFHSALPPAFIVGNGPSLDNLETLLKNHHHNVMIISCGTGISSLYKLGIKPDIHVEIERGLTPCQWIKMGTSAEYRKGITLLALNPVSPHTLDLFDKTLLALKPNDLGANVIKREINRHDFFEVPFCNPTATNCGMALSVYLGFTEIYLIGTDFGIKTDGKHHSKYSIHASIDAKRDGDTSYDPQQGKDYTYSMEQYPIKGNFCEQVATTTALDMSRRNIEICLENFPQINCYNPNDGAFIRGTIPINPQAINIENHTINKTALLDDLEQCYFENHKTAIMDKDTVSKKYLDTIFKIKPAFHLSPTCNNIEELHQNIERIFTSLEEVKKNDIIAYMMVKGSIHVMITLLYYYCSKAKNNEQFQHCYTIGHDTYSRMIDGIYHILETDPLRLDDSQIPNLPKEFAEKVS